MSEIKDLTKIYNDINSKKISLSEILRDYKYETEEYCCTKYQVEDKELLMKYLEQIYDTSKKKLLKLLDADTKKRPKKNTVNKKDVINSARTPISNHCKPRRKSVVKTHPDNMQPSQIPKKRELAETTRKESVLPLGHAIQYVERKVEVKGGKEDEL